MPLLANTPFIVTGSGKFFRNVQLDPAANLGIVKVDSDGAGYHILWGLTNEAVPTSELPAHFLSHCERIKATNGKDRVIMHCHATNLIALTYVLENDTAVFTRQLWEGSTECLVVFPDGVGILPWDGARHGRNRPGDRNKRCKTFAGVVALPRRLRQRTDAG
ncbi:rhamnulose-1-phosphate aldolase [Escherichia coli]|uniref:Rhamnulose-1-phosphate aldolase n=1 Tax=Escherichia coli TaxID=562 RepID=A0A377CBA8_ECOLX|nr:rhamnulose-1-phosphate aldolase [Escherichia coli]